MRATSASSARPPRSCSGHAQGETALRGPLQRCADGQSSLDFTGRCGRWPFSQVKIACYASIVLTFILVILWPLPMHIGGGVFNEGGLAIWVVLEILWAVIGGVVITVPPAGRSRAGAPVTEAGSSHTAIRRLLQERGRHRAKKR